MFRGLGLWVFRVQGLRVEGFWGLEAVGFRAAVFVLYLFDAKGRRRGDNADELHKREVGFGTRRHVTSWLLRCAGRPSLP